MGEVEKLKNVIVKLSTRLEETEKGMNQLQQAVNKTCEEVLSILRDGEHYHRISKQETNKPFNHEKKDI